MSKDKTGKKDKLKHLDLFGMMLNQSQVFRDMVEQFHSTWAPRPPSVEIEEKLSAPNAVKKQPKSVKAAVVTTQVKKRAAKKLVASKKPSSTVKRVHPKAPGNAKVSSGQPEPVTPDKTEKRIAAASRLNKKNVN